LANCLEQPGNCDLTAHVDLTSIQNAAVSEGLEIIGVLDQTYFLMGLGLPRRAMMTGGNGEDTLVSLKRRLAAKTLILPGGLGSTLKVMIFGKGVGKPKLRGCSAGMRST
jgi:SAM-dependent MidA family methyltransferase